MNLTFSKSLPSLILGIFLTFTVNCGSSDSSEDRETLLLLTYLNLQVQEGIVRSKDGTPIYFKKVGSGTPVVVLHGGPGLDHNYLVAPLSQTIGAGKQLIFFDQRGTGLSGGPVGPSNLSANFINKDKFLEDLDAIRTQLGLGAKINILGHSWGGLYAMLYASDDRYKDNVKSLALVGSAGANGGYYNEFLNKVIAKAGDPAPLFTAETTLRQNPSLNNLKAYYGFLFKFYFADYTPTGTNSGTSQNFSKLNLGLSTDKTILNGLNVQGRINTSIGFQFNNTGALTPYPSAVPNFTSDLSKITIPVLLVHGVDDVIPIDFILARGTTNLGGIGTGNGILNSNTVAVQNNFGTGATVTARPISNSGHFPFIEQPTAFTEAFQGFYNNL